MTIKSILAILTGTGSDGAVLDAAFAVARRFAAHIEAVHVRNTPGDVVVYGAPEALVATEDLIGAMEREARQREDAARTGFDRWRAEHGIAADGRSGGGTATAAWSPCVGGLWPVAGSLARYADLTIIANETDERTRTPENRLAIEAALFESGRPVLIVPHDAGSTARMLEHALIAWKSSAEAAHAVSAAMPLLADARRVSVFAVSDEDVAATFPEELLAYLRRHGIDAAAPAFPVAVTVGEALLNQADRTDATLLVMGAYTHSRLRELILGGVTDHVLNNARIPVLMAH
jgi:nucleotide-binding universal stress UspA family protein